jgi:ribosomal protein S19
MEITEKMLGEIIAVFRGVEYVRITFHISPEKKDA